MRLIKSKTANINYLAKIVNVESFEKHPNADSLKCAHVGGYNIIVGLDEPTGLYVYFPTSCEINSNILSYLNLYREKSLNANPECKPGFFENNGRVKAIKLRGIVSEGFLLPVESLNSFFENTVNKTLDFTGLNGLEFDACKNDSKEFWICKKYIVLSHFYIWINFQ